MSEVDSYTGNNNTSTRYGKTLVPCNQDFINLETQLNIRICIHVMITHHFQACQCITNIVHLKVAYSCKQCLVKIISTQREMRDLIGGLVSCVEKLEESALSKYSSACSSSPETEKKVSPQLSLCNVKYLMLIICSITEAHKFMKTYMKMNSF